MNRINKYTINGKTYFDVLITPNYISNPGMELVLGNWLDEDFNLYFVKTVRTLQDAMNISWQYPDINWERMVNMYKDNYLKLDKTLKKYLNNLSIPLTYEPYILSPNEAKKSFFNRVKNKNRRFTMYYNYNDVISFDIIIPFNLQATKIKYELEQIPELNIKKIITSQTHIKLIGITEFNTTYEIRIWTSLIHNFLKWIYINDLNIKDYYNTYKQIIQEQKEIDKKFM